MPARLAGDGRERGDAYSRHTRSHRRRRGPGSHVHQRFKQEDEGLTAYGQSLGYR